MVDIIPILALAGIDSDGRFLDHHREALGHVYHHLTDGTPAILAHSGTEVVVVLRLSTAALIHRVGRRNPDPVWKAVDVPLLVPAPAMALSERHARLAVTVAEQARDRFVREAMQATSAGDRELSETLFENARDRDDLAAAFRILRGPRRGLTPPVARHRSQGSGGSSASQTYGSRSGLLVPRLRPGIARGRTTPM